MASSRRLGPYSGVERRQRSALRHGLGLNGRSVHDEPERIPKPETLIPNDASCTRY